MSARPGFTREERVAIDSFAAVASVAVAGGATVLQVPEAPDSPMLNRVVGLGVEQPATEAGLDAALAAVGENVSFYVAVAAGAVPAQLPGWLRARGLQPSWGWMAFRRDLAPPPVTPATALQLVEATTPTEAEPFARIVCESYGLPAELQPRIAHACEHGWLCWVAWDGDEPAGAAGLYVAEGVGYLGFAGTLPQHRGKGAQSALLAERIRRAAALGCETLVTETGERIEGRPSNSYRNILRAGFTELEVTANWLGRR